MMIRTTTALLAGGAAIAVAASPSAAQSLFERPVEAGHHDAAPADSLRGMSILLVQPPEPRQFKIHDLVTIVIEESSRATSSQSLETDRQARTRGNVNAIIDPLQLLELRLRQGALSNQTIIDAGLNNEFKGEGDYERTDRLSTRVTAEIIDIKPNGTLVLQARKRIHQNGETQEYVLSGVCRQEDISSANTILSTQVADLAVIIHNEGQVRDAARKGWITRVLEGVFNF